MYCQNRIIHAIQQGETLQQLALRYETSIPSLLSLNPRLNPYKMPVGSKIAVCPGDKPRKSQSGAMAQAGIAATTGQTATLAATAIPVMPAESS